VRSNWKEFVKMTALSGAGLVATRQTAYATLVAFSLGLAGFPSGQASAQSLADAVRSAASASGLKSLATVGTPKVDTLNNFITTGAAAQRAAIQLGKAFFWDMQTGSDGQACASCHFHAGADNRTRNELSPGLKAGDTLFGNNSLGVPGFPQFRPDYTLVAADFPFHRVQFPNDNHFPHTVTQDTNDVTSSMGVFNANFTGIGTPLLDAGRAFRDAIFNLDNPHARLTAHNVRRVEPRNTPTMINAVFNHSNFWDGRAHNLFNGVSPIGPLDQGARIWVNTGGPGAPPGQVAVRISNSSLASQAVGPPRSDKEMSFVIDAAGNGRPFPVIGRKLLGLTPLGQQLVHAQDSVLGSLSKSPANGLNTTYTDLIQATFQNQYWNGADVTIGGQTFTQMEANFSLFWGLAIQMYETTLVSDQSPFDAFMAGNNSALTATQLRGLLVFLNRGTADNPPAVNNAIAAAGGNIGAGNCVACHSGPEFTGAAFSSLSKGTNLELIELEATAQLSSGLLVPFPDRSGLEDNGFANIGVRPTSEDLGRGAGPPNNNDFPFPLSFTRQALAGLTNLLPPGADLPCTLGPGGTCPPGTIVQVDGAFKIPGLRNAELTGPYFHNGGQATLSQVIDFYTRQGDFGDVNLPNTAGEIANINLNAASDKARLVAFLLSLTDDRVRFERTPFDHPQLKVPNGGTFASEQPRIIVPAVGAAGGPALGTFLGLTP
jgi:cytochrome c peroxidase